MAAWLTALKMVPWTDVIQAAPHVVKAAKSLLKKSSLENPEAEKPSPDHYHTDLADADPATLRTHIALLESRMAVLEQSNQESAILIGQIAQQQAQIVQTVGLLRTGITRLAWICSALGLIVLTLVLYIVFSS